MRVPMRRFALLAVAALLASTAQASNRALLIGVGDVHNFPLPAIDLDIDNMKKVAAVMGFKAGDIKVLYDEQATSANVHEALATWVRAGVGPNDKVLIYFSGHGTRVPDGQSARGIDDALVMHDATPATIQGRASVRNVLLGRELGAAIAKIPSKQVLVLVDACHSGTATRDLPLGNLSLGTATAVTRFYTYPGMPAPEPTGTATRALTVTRAMDVAAGSENYAALSAARDDEVASGTEQGGMFTLGVSGAIENAAREGKEPSVDDLRVAATTYIAAHLKEQDRSHPVADGNEQLIHGDLALLPLRNGQGPTWQSLVALAGKGQPLQIVAGSGISQIHVGEQIVLQVTVPHDGYLNVVTVDSQDRATVLYPNKFNPTNQVSAGTFRFPTAQMNFVVRASDPTGPSLVVAFLTDRKVNLLDLGVEGRDAAGKMSQAFTEVNARATRALVVEASEKPIAAGTLTVRVDPAGH
jgi:metacaspase-1